MTAATLSHTRASLLLVALSAAATVAAIDVALHAVAPPQHLREVSDAMAEYERTDPTILVIGSSHARTFVVLGDSLAARTGSRERTLAIPVEYGKLSSYRWVLEQRVQPLLREATAGGRAKRPSLRRFILVTEWWDSCEESGGLPPNLPARAWGWGHFIADVADHGLTPYNRNFLQNKWRELTRASSIVQDFGHGEILATVRRRLRPPSAADDSALTRQRISDWQIMVEAGVSCIGAAEQMEALSAMLDSATAWGLESTVLLYPRKPATLTERAKHTTLSRFSAMAARLAREHGARFIDLTWQSPLRDDEFAADFDHVTPRGNARFSHWALEGPLAFLAQPPASGLATP